MHRYDSLAERLGFKNTPEKTTIFTQTTMFEGLYDGEPIWGSRIHGSQSLTTRGLLKPIAPIPFQIGPETWATKLAHLVGKHDQEIGEPEFDRRFIVVTPHLEAVKQLLTPDLRHCLNRLADADWSFLVWEYGVDIISHPYSGSDTEDVIEKQIAVAVGAMRVLRTAIRETFPNS